MNKKLVVHTRIAVPITNNKLIFVPNGSARSFGEIRLGNTTPESERQKKTYMRKTIKREAVTRPKQPKV